MSLTNLIKELYGRTSPAKKQAKKAKKQIKVKQNQRVKGEQAKAKKGPPFIMGGVDTPRTAPHGSVRCAPRQKRDVNATRKVGYRIVMRRPDEIDIAVSGVWTLAVVTGWGREGWTTVKLFFDEKAKKNVFYLNVKEGRLAKAYDRMVLDTHHPQMGDWVINCVNNYIEGVATSIKESV